MNIWIVDDDVDFSHFLKDTLSHQLKSDYKLKVEFKLIYWFNSYLTNFDFAKKDKDNLPFFIFINPWMENKDYLNHYLEVVKNQKNLPSYFVITTYKAYGMIEDLLNQNGLKDFYYLQKKHLKGDLDKILKNEEIEKKLLELKNKKKSLPIKGFSQNRALKKCQGLAEEIEDIFYDKEDKDELIKNYQLMVSEINVLEIEKPNAWKKLEKLLEKPEKIGQLKLKRITQDLLKWFKEMEFISE
jgi:hypothetical protein